MNPFEPGILNPTFQTLTFAFAVKAIKTLPDQTYEGKRRGGYIGQELDVAQISTASKIPAAQMTESEIEVKYYPAEEKGLILA